MAISSNNWNRLNGEARWPTLAHVVFVPSNQRKGILPVLKPKSMTVIRQIVVGEAIARDGSAKN